MFDRPRSACFTICSTIFSTKIASRQQAPHHCYRKFIWIFNRWAREFTSHVRSRVGVLFFFGTSFVWQSEKWRKRLRKESVKSILKKICFTTRIFRYRHCHLRRKLQTTRETNISPDGKLQLWPAYFSSRSSATLWSCLPFMLNDVISDENSPECIFSFYIWASPICWQVCLMFYRNLLGI